MAEENFDGAIYAKFRSRTPAESAMEMARSNDISGLRIILTHHWDAIEPHYLQVLSSFPETTHPHDYRYFGRYFTLVYGTITTNHWTDWIAFISFCPTEISYQKSIE